MTGEDKTEYNLSTGNSTLVIIRKCEHADIDEVVEMCGEHAEFEKCSYSSSGKAARLKHLMFANKPALNCIVADTGTGLAGYASYTFDLSTWSAEYYLHLDCLYLRQFARGAGLGREIMKHVARAAIKNGIKEVQWQTPVFNTRAIAFYDKLGAVTKDKVRCLLYEEEILRLAEL